MLAICAVRFAAPTVFSPPFEEIRGQRFFAVSGIDHVFDAPAIKHINKELYDIPTPVPRFYRVLSQGKTGNPSTLRDEHPLAFWVVAIVLFLTCVYAGRVLLRQPEGHAQEPVQNAASTEDAPVAPPIVTEKKAALTPGQKNWITIVFVAIWLCAFCMEGINQACAFFGSPTNLPDRAIVFDNASNRDVRILADGKPVAIVRKGRYLWQDSSPFSGEINFTTVDYTTRQPLDEFSVDFSTEIPDVYYVFNVLGSNRYHVREVEYQ
jgi:hypothetical protein